MTIFKRKKVTKENDAKKVIGAYVPLSLIEYHELYALDLGISKASIVEEQLNNLKIRKEREGVTIPFLIASLAQTAIGEYNELNKEAPFTPSSVFLRQLKKELSMKDISEPLINDLLIQVQNGTCK